GELAGAIEAPSDDASVRYRPRLAAAVAKWREFRDAWAPTGRTPLIFVMAENTAAADQIAAYLETLPELGEVLTIHTNRAGEITKADMERARAAVRRVDEPDSPFAAIVSVLMLREGWDVRNVAVIVPLRAYTAKAQILPEQTLGRGLRRVTPPGSGVDERLVVIEHQAFRSLWDKACEEEGLELERRAAEDLGGLEPVVIAAEPDRMAHDIEIPQLPRVLTRSTARLSDLRVTDIPARRLRLADTLREDSVGYTGRDLLSGEVIEHATYPYPATGGREQVLPWYVDAIQRDSRLTGQFAVLAPLVEEWIETGAFGGPVQFDDPLVLQTLAEPAIQEQILAAFRQVLDEFTVSEAARATDEAKALRLSSTRPFLWSGETAAAGKSVFSAQPCDSGLEIRLVGFLDRCEDVDSFAKLSREVRFSLEYRNDAGRLAYYYPDFVVRMYDGTHMVLEAKGRVDLDVPRKDTRARRWVADATRLSGTRWEYIRVDEDIFDDYANRVATLGALIGAIRGRERAATLASLPASRRRTPEELVALMDESLAASGAVTGIDETIRRLREDPRAG
ncbi:MAG: hypothetical protein ACR2F6_09515, partial [Mycobacteriales bacterium]